MKKETFAQQIERLRNRWPAPFSDMGRVQKLADQFKFYDDEAVEQAVTHLLGSLKMAPIDAELLGAVTRFSRRPPQTAGRRPAECKRCNDAGTVEVWDLWGSEFYPPGKPYDMRCPCAKGMARTFTPNSDGEEITTFHPDMVGNGKRWSLERPLPVFKEAGSDA